MKLKVISEANKLFDNDVEFVVLPGQNGEIGVLPNHAPLIANLTKGDIRITLNGNKEETLSIDGGFLEVEKNLITVLAKS